MLSRYVAGIDAINLTVQITVAMLAAIAALRFAMSGSSITREHIYAALSAYVLAGVFAGAFYSVMERTWPDSFVIGGQAAHGQLPLPTAAYFSFVTLATLGYGDIVPASDAARSLVVFEAIAGQLYLAVMVARLVSLYVVGELKKREDRDFVRSPAHSAIFSGQEMKS
jgi:voltage-gated potassium channel